MTYHPFRHLGLKILAIALASVLWLADLPQSQAKSLQEDDSAPVEVSIDENGIVFIGESEIERERLIPLLTAMTEGQGDRRIFLRADRSLDYGEVMGILGAINAGGFQRVALISVGG